MTDLSASSQILLARNLARTLDNGTQQGTQTAAQFERLCTVVGQLIPCEHSMLTARLQQLERQRRTEGALADMEEQLAAAMRPKRRRAPNGDTLDAQEFLESIGQSTLRCSACELVAAKFEKAIDEELVAGWAGNTSAERAEALRTTLPKRACAKMKRMAIAMEGDEASLKYVDLTDGTDADFAAGDFGAMGLQHRETVRALCSNHNPHPHPRRTFNLTLTRCARSAPSSQRWTPSPWSLSLSTVSSRSQACGSTSSICETRSA